MRVPWRGEPGKEGTLAGRAWEGGYLGGESLGTRVPWRGELGNKARTKWCSDN